MNLSVLVLTQYTGSMPGAQYTVTSYGVYLIAAPDHSVVYPLLSKTVCFVRPQPLLDQ